MVAEPQNAMQTKPPGPDVQRVYLTPCKHWQLYLSATNALHVIVSTFHGVCCALAWGGAGGIGVLLQVHLCVCACVRGCMRDPEFLSPCVCACVFVHVCPFVSLLLCSFRSRSLIWFFRLKCLVVFLTTPLSFNFFLPGLCSLFDFIDMALSELLLSHCGALARVCKFSH